MNIGRFVKRNLIEIILGLGIIGFAVWGFVYKSPPQQPSPKVSNTETPKQTPAKKAPELVVGTVISGLTNPWDIGFIDDNAFIYTERGGQISYYDNSARRLLAKPTDVTATGEGGLMGLSIDPDFKTNRYIYTCFVSDKSGKVDVRVVRWKVNGQATSLTDRADIVTGIVANSSGRHSGCRPRFGPDGYLWIGTGDAALPGVAQDPKSLGGKILRVDRDGRAVAGNVGGNFDARIYSYGHRNVQGLAFNIAAGKAVGYSIEHGSSVDDEVNALDPGNFGWALSGLFYNESGVPMTDKKKFPDAKDAIWSSGNSTIAPSGATMLLGKQWGSWEGSLAMAVLKGRQLKVLHLDVTGNVASEETVITDQGRLRSAVQGPDGNLYITTDNGKGSDKILKVTPKL